MKDSKVCSMIQNFGSCLAEVLGVVLIIIAALLTVITQDSLGIVAMFVIGLLLCCHKCFHKQCPVSKEEEGSKSNVAKKASRPAKRTSAKSVAKEEE